MKRLVPLLALVPVAVSIGVSGKFAYPTTALIASFALLLALVASRDDSESVPGLGLFWLGPLSVVWSLSERHEGREIWRWSVPIGLGLSALGTLWVLRRSIPRHQVYLVWAAILTWCVSYFGGSSGGADNMRPYYSLFGLSPELTWTLIMWTRKLIHVTFYSLLATCFYRFLVAHRAKPFLPALAFALTMAICDEWRQNMMPNREGSYRDVLLDIGAASLWLWWRYLRKSSTKPAALDSDGRS